MNSLSTEYRCIFLWTMIGICSACEDPESAISSNGLQDMRIELAESDAISLVLDDEQDESFFVVLPRTADLEEIYETTLCPKKH